jgi:hypothetical protein
LLDELPLGQYQNAMSPKVKIGVTVAILLNFSALFQMQQLKIKRLVAENSDLRSQLGQMGSLQDTNESLVEKLKSTVASSQTNQKELLRLRGQGLRLRQLEQENAQLKAQRQQIDRQMQQPQAEVISSEQRPTAVSEVARATADSPHPYKTDLGSLELQSGIAVHFDLGGGTNCAVTPTALSDGNYMMEIKVGVTNADGVFSELGTSRITAPPGHHCSVSVGDRMIALAVTLKPQ